MVFGKEKYFAPGIEADSPQRRRPPGHRERQSDRQEATDRDHEPHGKRLRTMSGKPDGERSEPGRPKNNIIVKWKELVFRVNCTKILQVQSYITKSLDNQIIKAFLFPLRRGGDSNPRYPLKVRQFSKLLV